MIVAYDNNNLLLLAYNILLNNTVKKRITDNFSSTLISRPTSDTVNKSPDYVPWRFRSDYCSANTQSGYIFHQE